MLSDKRRAFRMPVEWNVKIELNGRSFDTSCISVSEGGVRIEGVNDDMHLRSLIINHLDIANGRPVEPEISVKIPTTLQEISLKGKVRWFRTDNVAKKHHIGIAFTDQPDISIYRDSMHSKTGIIVFPK